MSLYRVQLMWASQIAGGVPITTAFWCTSPSPAAAALCLQVGGLPIALVAAEALTPPTSYSPTPTDLRDCAKLVFSDSSGRYTCQVNVPSAPGWYQDDGETIDPTDAGVLAVAYALGTTGGLANGAGVATPYLRAGQFNRITPAPWPTS